MTTSNGANHRTVEDLLSSIRSTIGEEAGGLRQGPSMPMPSHRDGSAADDHSEFELPAIFKTGHQQHHGRANNLFGRLSDALKPVSPPEPDRSRTVIRFEPAGGRMYEPPQPASSMPPKDDAIDQVNRVATENATSRREMTSFFDTRMSKLGNMASYTPPPEKPVEPEPPVQRQAEPPVLTPRPPPLNHPMQQSAEQSSSQASSSESSGGGLEDAAAQLLRPILKQWLSENMPKIVEKALRNESGVDIPGPGPRKNGL